MAINNKSQMVFNDTDRVIRKALNVQTVKRVKLSGNEALEVLRAKFAKFGKRI